MRAYSTTKIAGLEYSKEQIVDQYIQSLRPIRDPDLKFQIKFWSNVRDKERLLHKSTALNVLTMQLKLQREEETLQQMYSTLSNETRRVPRMNQSRQKSEAVAMATSAKTKSDKRPQSRKPLFASKNSDGRPSHFTKSGVQQSNDNRSMHKLEQDTVTSSSEQPCSRRIKCYGFQSTKHVLRDCLVTLPMQKKRLYREMKKRFAAKRQEKGGVAANMQDQDAARKCNSYDKP
jgi:hypothetical protein